MGAKSWRGTWRLQGGLSGRISLLNRYYDPTTDQFLSVDPYVATTNEPYVFTNDDPLNAADPLGLTGIFIPPPCKSNCGLPSWVVSAINYVTNHPLETIVVVLAVASVVVSAGADGGVVIEVVAYSTGEVGGVTAVSTASSTINYLATTAGAVQMTQDCLTGNYFQCGTSVVGAATGAALKDTSQFVQSSVAVAQQLFTPSVRKAPAKPKKTTKHKTK